MPQASNSFFRLELVSVGGTPLASGWRPRLAPRIDHHHQPAAAHDELVDGVLRGVGQVLGLGDQQHLDVGIDHLRVGGNRLHLVGLAQQHGRCIGLPATTSWPCIAIIMPRIAVERQRRHHADDGRFGLDNS